MVNDKYVVPEIWVNGFNCPHCHAYAHQQWRTSVHGTETRVGGKSDTLDSLAVSICDRCGKYALWLNDQLIYPQINVAPTASSDMSESVKKDYEEASSIFNQSSRGSAALLRLAIQKLMGELGENSTNLNEAIGNLVNKGLPIKIQKALDVVRVVGNNAVHPGQITIEDNPEIALSLFTLINLIIDTMITKTKEIDNLYNKLPKSAKDAIADRDKKG
jgi:hypothetical protein